MKYEDEEMQYNDVIKTLKSLQKVKAPPYFAADLKRKINAQDFGEETQGFWEKFFLPSRLIPSAGLAVAAVILLFVLNTNVFDETENPLLSNPKVREDVVVTATAVEDADPEKYIEKSVGRDEIGNSRELASRETLPETSYSFSDRQPAVSEASFTINKSGLNFRQINLSPEERAVINNLKEKIQILMKKKGE